MEVPETQAQEGARSGRRRKTKQVKPRGKLDPRAKRVVIVAYIVLVLMVVVVGILAVLFAS